MSAFLIRTSIRLAFYTTALYVVLRMNASSFDATEVTSMFEFVCFALAFETGMACLPARLAGKLRLPNDPSGELTVGAALRFTGGVAAVLFCAVFIAVAIDIRREIGGLREAFASGDVQTTWPDGIELRTVRTTKTSESDWFERHVAAVREARARPR